jgi:hypothetical protein
LATPTTIELFFADIAAINFFRYILLLTKNFAMYFGFVGWICVRAQILSKFVKFLKFHEDVRWLHCTNVAEERVLKLPEDVCATAMRSSF